MMPEPVPPGWLPVTEMVTTLGLAFAATAVIWLTESVSFTTMFCASPALSFAEGESLLVMSVVMPAPDAPPMRAAATIAAATPSPTRRCFGAGWVAAGVGPPKAGGTCPVTGCVGAVGRADAADPADAAGTAVAGALYGC